MNVDTKKVSGFFADFKTIWIGVAFMIAGAGWAGDLRWMQLAGGDAIVKQVELSSMQRRIEELEIQKAYEKNPQKIKMIEALIAIKKSKMRLIK